MAGDITSTHDFLTLGDDSDEETVTRPSMLDKPDIKPDHQEPSVPPAPAGSAAGKAAVAGTAAAAVATTAAATQAKGGTPPADRATSNNAAYQKLKADRAKAREARQRSKKKADPLEAELTNIEKEKDDLNKKYAEGSGAGMAVLIIACLILLAVCAVMFYLHGDQIIETVKTTPWFRYVFLAVAMYSYANSKY